MLASRSRGISHWPKVLSPLHRKKLGDGPPPLIKAMLKFPPAQALQYISDKISSFQFVPGNSN